MGVMIAKCPNKECPFYKKFKVAYEWALKKKSLKNKFRVCPKCKKVFNA